MTVALVLIDMQMGMAERMASGSPRANPDAEERVADLLALFRGRGLPVIHVHHDDADPASPFRRGAPGGAPMPCAAPLSEETVLWKSGSSAFSGTGLDAHLRRLGAARIFVAGAVAGFCVTSSTRAASDLGFQAILPGDALLAFDIPAHDGGRIGADTVLRVTLSLLGADFATLIAAADASAHL
jgi:nicotinamidase-related amidase